jgi:hypothetical protein
LETKVLDNKRLCACGCGEVLVKRWGRERKYIRGHNARLDGFGRGRQHIRSGRLHPRWKGGRTFNHAYVELSAQYNHPRNNQGRVLEHIIVFEQHHSCCLLSWANVHHKDGNKANNVWYNLEGMMRGQHLRHHHLDKSTVDHSMTRCVECGSDKTFLKKNSQGIRIFPTWRRLHKGSDLWLCINCNVRRYRRSKMKKH